MKVKVPTDPRAAIAEATITCLECGGQFLQLTNTHLRRHGLTAPDYKRRHGYNVRRPLMARSLVRRYASRAVAQGLAARIRVRPILVRPELRRLGGRRAISREAYLTRHEARERSRS